MMKLLEEVELPTQFSGSLGDGSETGIEEELGSIPDEENPQDFSLRVFFPSNGSGEIETSAGFDGIETELFFKEFLVQLKAYYLFKKDGM